MKMKLVAGKIELNQDVENIIFKMAHEMMYCEVMEELLKKNVVIEEFDEQFKYIRQDPLLGDKCIYYEKDNITLMFCNDEMGFSEYFGSVRENDTAHWKYTWFKKSQLINICKDLKINKKTLKKCSKKDLSTIIMKNGICPNRINPNGLHYSSKVERYSGSINTNNSKNPRFNNNY
jgi:hypothetical protein